MENKNHTEVNAPSKLLRIAYKRDSNEYEYLDKQSIESQEEFAKIESFKVGDFINLRNKKYKISQITLVQAKGKTQVLSSNGNQTLAISYEVEILLDLEEY